MERLIDYERANLVLKWYSFQQQTSRRRSQSGLWDNYKNPASLGLSKRSTAVSRFEDSMIWGGLFRILSKLLTLFGLRQNAFGVKNDPSVGAHLERHAKSPPFSRCRGRHSSTS